MEMIIRPELVSDAEAVCRVHHAAVAAIADQYYALELRQAWISSCTVASVQAGILATIGFVAEIDGVVVGFGALHKDEVRVLYVHPNYQGQGIGKALLEKLESMAIAQGITKLHLKGSLNAAAFYEAMGYQSLNECSTCVIDKHVLPCLKMEKLLAIPNPN